MTAAPFLALGIREVAGFVLVFLVCALASCGGLGGGGMLVPLLVMVFGFSTHDATPLSNVAILAGAVASLSVNVFKSHPRRAKPNLHRLG